MGLDSTLGTRMRAERSAAVELRERDDFVLAEEQDVHVSPKIVTQ